ncbi:MAG TPA: hypothetical protein PKA42_02300 [Candidatus Paceibacterota bacterium]|nr:hypothetical protein [Candidatus Paceibacterota bacterium]HMO82975.1 hypothetical protein [Candidatus Paceibacterota bacterium]
MSKKKQILLTDIQLHNRERRPTEKFSKAVEGNKRLYCSPRIVKVDHDTFTITVSYDLPEDLSDELRSGETELAIESSDIPIYLGKDTIEQLHQMKRKQNNREFYRSPTRVSR